MATLNLPSSIAGICNPPTSSAGSSATGSSAAGSSAGASVGAAGWQAAKTMAAMANKVNRNHKVLLCILLLQF